MLCFLPSAEEGKLATGEIPLHDGGHLKWIHRVLMAAYLLFTNVLLINLLIAIFRYSFNQRHLPHFTETLSRVTKQRDWS